MRNMYVFQFVLDPKQREENEEFTLQDFVDEYDSPQIKNALENWGSVYDEFFRRREEVAKAEDERAELIKDKEISEYVDNKEYIAVTSKIRELETAYEKDYPDEYAAILYDNQPEQLRSVLDAYQKIIKEPGAEKGRQLEKFRFLASFCEQIQRSSSWREKDGENVCRLQVRSDTEGKNSIVLMKLENLGGTGLSFTIEDGRSIVFAKDSRLNRRQVAEMSRFFADRGMSIEDFSKLKGLKVYDDRDDQKEIGSFEEIFKQESQQTDYKNKSLAELLDIQEQKPHDPVVKDEIERRVKNGEDTNNALPVTDENTTQAAVSGENYGGDEGVSFDGKAGFASYLNDEAKPRTYREMRKAIHARAGIMRISPNCIVEKRMPDGSIVISLYGSEADKEADGKMNKDGVVQHKKKVAFRMWKNPPRVSIYVPDGAEFKAAYAKGALKAGGQPYFYMPSADEFGGDAQKAFWEAAGDTLTCPILKSKDHPEGCSMGNDHLTVILKAMNDKNDGSEYEKMIFKMRLVEQIRGHLEYVSGGKPEKENKPLKDSMEKLEGEIKFARFKAAVLPELKDFVVRGINGKIPETNGRKWNQVDLGCAYKAMGNIATAINNGTLPINYFTGSPDLVMQRFQQEMQKVKPEVEETFKEHLGGNAETGDYGDVKESAIAGKCNNALSAIKDEMNLQFEKVASCGAEEAKLEFKINDRGALTPKTTEIDKGRYTIVSRSIPGVPGNAREGGPTCRENSGR